MRSKVCIFSIPFSVADILSVLLNHILFLIASEVQAQAQITGSVHNGEKPVVQANILLLSAADSALVRGVLSDSEGRFAIHNVNPGRYFVSLSHSGYLIYRSETFEVTPATNKELGKILLTEHPVQLDEVVVRVTKPLLEQQC